MHHLHFRYVAEEPRAQTIGRLLQLLDDMPADLRHDLLRDVFTSFNSFSDLTDEKEQQAAQYTDLKSKLQALVAPLPEEQPVVYGLVCFILGNAYARHALRLPGLIDRKRALLRNGLRSELRSIRALREEADLLRTAYTTFCELVVGALLGGDQPIDFGNEWAFDDSEPIPPEVTRASLAEEHTGLAIGEESDPIITSFLDKLGGQFEVVIRTGPKTLALRVMDKAVSVSVGVYSAPHDRDPSQPRILRLNIMGVSLLEKAVFRRLGLPLNPKYYLKCRLEFSVLPEELGLLWTWTAEWLRGQASESVSGPSIPIPVDGGEASFSSSDPDWRAVDYLWSSAARDAYRSWEKRKKAQ